MTFLESYAIINNSTYKLTNAKPTLSFAICINKVNDSMNGLILNQSALEYDAITHFKSMYLEIFNAKLKELDYDSIATVQLWINDATFGAEATKIMTWYKALITKNYAILNDAKTSGVIPTDKEYLIEIAKVVF